MEKREKKKHGVCKDASHCFGKCTHRSSPADTSYNSRTHKGCATRAIADLGGEARVGGGRDGLEVQGGGGGRPVLLVEDVLVVRFDKLIKS